MNSTSQAWQGAGEHFAMDAAADDFNNLIDFDLDNLGDFSYAQTDFTQPGPAPLADLPDSLVVNNLHGHFSPQLTQDHRNGIQQSANNGFFDYSMGQFSQAGTPAFPQAQDHMYRPHQGVPPTPNSVEMHGDPHRYLQQMDPQQALFDQRYHMRKDDATFTPLVSPAVTPHDARFTIPDFSVPGAYFSPLTSPALNAQANQHAHQHSQHATSGSSTGHSPIDVDIDMLGDAAMVPQDQGRRTRSTNKRNVPRTTNGNGRVRQSPIVKANRRKATVSSLIPPKEVSELVQEARSSRPTSNGLDAYRTRESSQTDSISPEPMLSDMRPPPKPGSLTASPAIMAQFNGQATPATPASLMRIHPSPNFSGSTDAPPTLEDLTLPEASLDRPGPCRSNTVIHDSDQDTPRMLARKTPKLNPLSTPGTSMSGTASPMLDAMSTPTSPALFMANGKKELRPARNPKKRNSVSSNLVSPALRPKISPSIKPLLPDGGSGVPDSTHALLLASKSNYQNILDGTTVPGVVYPTSLSTNLTSKRTSHKIAEQGRRNRINMALQEMQALLPSPQIGAASPDAKSPTESAAQQSNNSKAAKVESAIDYIKQLKQQVSERDDLLNKKDEEMEQLRKELAALRRSSSVGSTAEIAAQFKVEPSASPNTDNGT
ncbi:hypothetical protein ACN47E_000393 [Coniothyrium glycines]